MRFTSLVCAWHVRRGGGDRMLALVKEEKGKTDILWTAKV